jgi:transcriptional regulator with XRE-family HTH domain
VSGRPSRRRRFSDEAFGPTLQQLMDELGVSYRNLAEKTKLSAGYLNHIVHGSRPVPTNDVISIIAKALGAEPEHFREYRIRVITDRLEQLPDLVDRLYKRLASE